MDDVFKTETIQDTGPGKKLGTGSMRRSYNTKKKKKSKIKFRKGNSNIRRGR